VNYELRQLVVVVEDKKQKKKRTMSSVVQTYSLISQHEIKKKVSNSKGFFHLERKKTMKFFSLFDK